MGERKAKPILGESFEKEVLIIKVIRHLIALISEHLCSFSVDIFKYVHDEPFGYNTWDFFPKSKGALIIKKNRWRVKICLMIF